MDVPEHTKLPANSGSLSCAELLNAVKGTRSANFNRARDIAKKIRDPQYSLREYHDDMMVAFPELCFYTIEDSQVTSGGTPVEECP